MKTNSGSTSASSSSTLKKGHVEEELKVEESKSKFSNEEHSNLIVKAYADGEKYLRISVESKDVEECPPVDLFCCIDVSGSMGWSCAGKTDGRTEYVENGFSLLDLVRHALKTVIKTLRPQDRLCFMTFNNSSKVVMPFTKMD